MVGNVNFVAAGLVFQGRRGCGTILLLAFAFFLSSLSAVAQDVTQTGQITGTVKDPSGAMVAGANVVLKDLQGGVKATAASDGEGVYLFPSVQPGSYVVEVDAKGFKHVISSNLEVAAGQAA